MSEFINTIDLLGDDIVRDRIINRSITEISDNVVTSIGNHAFDACTNLTSVDFPLVTSIGKAAFQNCTNLTSVDFPSVTSISNYAFYSCTNLTSVDFPLVTSIGQSAFRSCSTLISVDFPLVTSLDITAFEICSNLTSINFPAVTSIGTSVFQSCSSLISVDFPSVTSIGKYSFRNCSRLTSLILRTGTVCTLSNTNAISSTPIASGAGYIYVPSALVDSYKTATNWSTYAAQFRALEDYTVDGTITGELDATKVNPIDPAWQSLFNSIDSGTYATDYSIGDTIPLNLGSEGVINMQIVAFDTDDKADGSGKAPITFISKELLKTTLRTPSSSDGGWETSSLRSHMNDNIMPLIPEQVRTSLVSTARAHTACDSSGSLISQTTQDTVWIPSKSEVIGYNALYLDVYKNENSYHQKTIVGDTKYTGWFLRDLYTSSKWLYVYKNGSYGGTDLGYTGSYYGIALGFCL